MACPQLAKADIRPPDGNSRFDPLRKSGGPKCCDAQHGFFNDVVGCYPRLEGAHETTRVHHACRRRSRLVAVGGAGAAAIEAPDYRVLGLGHAFELGPMDHGLCAAAARTTLHKAAMQGTPTVRKAGVTPRAPMSAIYRADAPPGRAGRCLIDRLKAPKTRSKQRSSSPCGRWVGTIAL
jgi:hypothetical protein